MMGAAPLLLLQVLVIGGVVVVLVYVATWILGLVEYVIRKRPGEGFVALLLISKAADYFFGAFP